jgi:hypothetical protein
MPVARKRSESRKSRTEIQPALVRHTNQSYMHWLNNASKTWSDRQHEGDDDVEEAACCAVSEHRQSKMHRGFNVAD